MVMKVQFDKGGEFLDRLSGYQLLTFQDTLHHLITWVLNVVFPVTSFALD
jgi:hypothetical protein